MTADKILEPAEIDALINGVDSGAVSTQPTTAPGEAHSYDFREPKRMVRGRLPAMALINERFARAFRQSLYNLLRRSADITVKPLKMERFSDYVQTLATPTSLNLVRVNPLRGTGLVVIDPALVFTIVDHFFGGTGRSWKIEGREFTATEQRIIHMLLRNIFADLRDAWSPVTHIELEYLQSEVNPQFAPIESPAELVLVSAHHIELAGGGGDMHVTLPYSMIEPLREVLDTGPTNTRLEKDPRWSGALREEIEGAEIELRVLLGNTSLTLAGLLNLKPDDILPCDFAGKVTLCAEDLPVFRGSFGLSRGQQAMKIEERLRRPTPAHDTSSDKV
ncbi:MAG TPA: flagellar motor switch protein FliM [Steroidobacteraceae bacterium]|nr:flagellar motor switch protein FliM [Steroidobacteraceae bacterium]